MCRATSGVVGVGLWLKRPLTQPQKSAARAATCDRSHTHFMFCHFFFPSETFFFTFATALYINLNMIVTPSALSPHRDGTPKQVQGRFTKACLLWKRARSLLGRKQGHRNGCCNEAERRVGSLRVVLDVMLSIRCCTSRTEKRQIRG